MIYGGYIYNNSAFVFDKIYDKSEDGKEYDNQNQVIAVLEPSTDNVFLNRYILFKCNGAQNNTVWCKRFINNEYKYEQISKINPTFEEAVAVDLTPQPLETSKDQLDVTQDAVGSYKLKLTLSSVGNAIKKANEATTRADDAASDATKQAGAAKEAAGKADTAVTNLDTKIEEKIGNKLTWQQF